VSGLTPQVTIDTIGLKQDLIITIRSLENKLATASNELTYAQGQIANTNTALSGLNTRLSAAQAIVAATPEALAAKNNLIAGISNEITVMTNLNNIAQQTVTTKTSETTALVTDINSAKTKLGGLG
jgi:chromosome segregation ATPase